MVGNSAIRRLSALDATAILVYLAICMRADGRTGECWPSLRTIGNDIGGVDRANVSKAVRRLVASGLIEKVCGRGVESNRYRVLVNPPTPPVLAKLPTGVGGSANTGVGGDTKGGVGRFANQTRTNRNKNQKNKNQEPEGGAAGTPATLASQELLMFLLREWNARSLGPKVTEDPLPSYVAAGWAKVQRNRELRELFKDQAAIEDLLTAIPENKWATGSDWFGFASLFEKDSNKTQWKAAKLLARQYRGNGRRQLPFATGPGFEYEGDAA